MYTALSWVKTYDNLYCVEKLKKSAIMVNNDELIEYKCLEQNDLFSTIKRNAIQGDTVTALVHTVRSLLRHVDDLISDNRIINNVFMGFTELKIKLSDSTSKIVETLNFCNINFNNTENNFLNLAYRYRNEVLL